MADAIRRRRGDRKDGRLLRSLSPINRIIPHLMIDRSDSQIFYEESFEVSAVDKTLRKDRVDGYKNIGFLHFIIAAYIRCISMLPGVNRFVNGRRIYARNSIEIVMIVKRSLSMDSSESTIKVVFEPTDTIYDVYRKVNDRIDEIKSSDDYNSTEDFADAIARLPRPVLRLALSAIRFMDYLGVVPQSWLNSSPFHGSLIISDTSSLKIGPVYHHIPNFGNLPVFVSFGAKHHKYEVNRHGEVEDNKYIDCKFVLDERIVDSHYYSQFLQALRYIFQHPEIVELPPSRVNNDVN